MKKNDPKIAIIGAGPAGLACALECERLGVTPDIFERNYFLDWIWPDVSLWFNVFEPNMGGDIIAYMKDRYDIGIKPLAKCTELIMKGPSKRATISGNIGYYIARGATETEALARQLSNSLRLSTIHYRRAADYKELSKEYDYVVVATDSHEPAQELGIWEDFGEVNLFGGIGIGKFNVNSTTIYFNRDYAGRGYARVTPLNATHALIGIANIGHPKNDMPRLYDMFLKYEKLNHFSYPFTFYPQKYITGRVKKYQVKNVLLVGRAAGLTERLMGAGGIAALISGVFAARAIIKGKDYDQLVQPVRNHIENISAFRDIIERLDNDGIDKLIALIDTPGVKQIIYNPELGAIESLGKVLKFINSLIPQQDEQSKGSEK